LFTLINTKPSFSFVLTISRQKIQTNRIQIQNSLSLVLTIFKQAFVQAFIFFSHQFLLLIPNPSLVLFFFTKNNPKKFYFKQKKIQLRKWHHLPMIISMNRWTKNLIIFSSKNWIILCTLTVIVNKPQNRGKKSPYMDKIF
ncbi:unnamed protein product, partial [Arabidopsis halleri]